MKFGAALLIFVGTLFGVAAIFHTPAPTPAAIALFNDGDENEDNDRHKPDQPDEAIRFRNLQLQDEKKQIPADGLLNGKAHLELMKEALVRRAEKTGSMEVASVQPGDWVSIGPGNIGGRIRAIAIDPTNANHIWIGSASGGIWSTTNGGTSWVPADDFMANLAISTLVVNPTNPNELYAGTGESFAASGLRGLGVFKSTNGGLTWNQVAKTNPADPIVCPAGGGNCPWFYVNRLAISPDGSAILAATGDSIWRSTNGGTTWSVALAISGAWEDVVFHPTDSQRVIASSIGVSAYSTDGGRTWTAATFDPPIPVDPPLTHRVELAYAPSSPNIVYASLNANSGEIYRSTDGGQSFVRVQTGSSYLSTQGNYANIIWVNPQDANVVVVGGLDLWRSTNAAVANPINLTQISQWQCAPQTGSAPCPGISAHADHHMIVAAAGFNNTTNKRVYFGNDGGIYRTDDVSAVGLTNGWVSLNAQLGITQFYSAVATADLTLIGGTQDNGNLRNPPDTSYTPPYNSQAWSTPSGAGGDGGFVATDPTDYRYVFAEYSKLLLMRSVDGGASFGFIYCNPANIDPQTRICSSSTGIADAFNGANFVAPFILDPSNPDRMLAGGLSLWRANDVKSALVPTWSAIKLPVSNGLPAPDTANVPISAIVVARNNPDLIFVGHNEGQIFRTSNGTAASPTWTRVDAGVPDRFVTRLTIDSTKSPNWIYATLGGFSSDNVYVSKDLGASWTDVTGTGATGLPDVPVRSLVISPVNPKNLYVGTEVGLFASEDAGATWLLPQGGPANVSVDEVFYSGRHLLAATFGRGIYTTENTFAAPLTYTWNASNGSNWLNSARWSGGDLNRFPGVDNNANSTADGGLSDHVEFGSIGNVFNSVQILMQSFNATGVNNDTGANGALTLASIRTLPSLNRTLLLENGSSTPSGVVTLLGGTVNGIENTILANDSAQTFFLSSGGGGMTWALGNPTSNVIQVNGAGQITLANVSGASRQLEKIGPGTLLLSGFNTWTGGTVLNGGTIRVNPNVILGSTTAPLTINGGTFDMASEDQTVGALNGTGGMIVANAAGSQAKLITVGNGGANGFYGGVIANRTSGNQLVSLVKIGTGTQNLSGSNTYTAGTAVNAGTLLVYNTSGSGTGTQLVSLPGNAGATFGGGTVDGTGGIAGQLLTQFGTPANHISPSSSSGETGILRVGSLSAQGILNLDIGGATVGTMYDQVSADSTASFVGSLYVKFLNSFESSIQAADVFDIIITGTGTVSRVINNLNSSGRLNVLGTQGSFAIQLVNSNKTLRLTDFQVGSITFASWAAANNLSGANAAATADPDFDGLTNFQEYAFARNPNVSDNSALTQPTTVQTGGQDYLALTFVRPVGGSAPTDLTYIYERSTTGPSGSWSSAGLVVTSVPGPNNTETVTVRSASPINTLPREFLRVRVTSP